jgi:hypothetical protein
VTGVLSALRVSGLLLHVVVMVVMVVRPVVAVRPVVMMMVMVVVMTMVAPVMLGRGQSRAGGGESDNHRRGDEQLLIHSLRP